MQEVNMKSATYKWVEGLILLAVIVIVLLFTSYQRNQYITILDEPVSKWSGTIDNLE